MSIAKEATMNKSNLYTSDQIHKPEVLLSKGRDLVHQKLLIYPLKPLQ